MAAQKMKKNDILFFTNIFAFVLNERKHFIHDYK